jgi:IS1 family transposase
VRKSKYPRLRSHTRKGKSGQVWTWYTYDMRPDGGTEISLGKDYAKALEQWHKLHNHLPMIKGTIQEAIDRWRAECLPLHKDKTREDYTRHLARIEPVFGKAAWHQVTVPVMRQYLDKRTAKTQGNRELSVLSILWGMARRWGMTELEWPARDLKGWKNPEKPRAFEVTDEMFAAVHHEADQVLKDCMDLASATGMRLTDVRTIAMPSDGLLRFRAGKTSKGAYFVVDESPVLSALVERRKRRDVPCTMLIITPTGRALSERMLRERYDAAREAAAVKAEKSNNPGLASQIRAMYLRDMRKLAADLAGDSAEASKLLQHSSTALTEKHYRTRGTKLKAVK